MDTKTFVSTLAQRLGRKPEDVELLIKSFTDLLAESVKEGNTISMPGFGSFEPKMKQERVATHPSTGKKLLVPPRLSVIFKPSAILKQKIRKQ